MKRQAAGGAAGLTGVIVAIAAHDTLAAILAADGVVLSAASYVVNHDGIRGTLRALWRGR